MQTVSAILMTAICSADKITENHLFYHAFELHAMSSQCLTNGKALKNRVNQSF